MNETTTLLKRLVKRAFECHDAAASSNQLPDNTVQPTTTSTSGDDTSTGTPARSAARQDILVTFLEKCLMTSAEFNSFLSDQELQIEALKRSLAEQKAKVTDLERQLEDRERNIFQRESGVAQQEQVVSEREQVVAAREQVVAKREQMVKEREQAALIKQEKIALEPEQFQKNQESAR